MSFDTLLAVRELPWAGLTRDLRNEKITSSESLIQAADLDWEVAAIPMKTELHEKVLGYHAVYRTDTNQVLGAVNTYRPHCVQNRDMFFTIEHMIGNGLSVETAATFDGGKSVFGSFLIEERYKVLDDDVAHYFVVLNEHLRPDGKVTVLNTPIRIVCQNTLTAALSNNLYKMRIPVYGDAEIYASVCERLMEGVGTCIDHITTTAEKLVKERIDSRYLDAVMDVLFPYQLVDGVPEDNKANQVVSICRDTFIQDCMGAEDLNNYRGTKYQIMQACLDFDQHYYKKADNAYKLSYRMTQSLGIGTVTSPLKITQFLKIKDKIAA